jgi:colanic acid/amylovoran biosynthesis protein
MKILLIGMWGLYNRGCEAIVRGSAKILKQIYPGAEVSVAVGIPESVAADRQRLPDFEGDIYPLIRERRLLSLPLRIVRRLVRELTGHLLYNSRKFIGYPTEGWDLVFEVGGDTYAADPTHDFQHDQWLMREKGLKLGLWGLNLGPYDEQMISPQKLKSGFSQYSLITVRDDFSKAYLADLGVERNVFRMADPAFEMDPEPWDFAACLPLMRDKRIIGLNLSPLIAKFFRGGIPGMIQLARELTRKLHNSGFGVVFIPHCFPPACPAYDDDLAVLRPAYDQIQAENIPVGLIPGGLSSPQVKFAISQCDLFIAARMHSGIAAWSTGVPVLMLSYSQKSLNLNDEIYGHRKYVLDIREVTPDKAASLVSDMVGNIDEIKQATINGTENLRKHTIDLISLLKV